MSNVSVGLDSQMILESLGKTLQSPEETTIDQLRDFSKWLLIFPVVMTLIFASAQLGLLLRYHFVFPQMKVDPSAEYGPWSYQLIHAIRPDIVNEIRIDRGNESKTVFTDPEKITLSWAGAEPTKENKSVSSTHTPTPTDSVASPSPSEPSATPTSSPTMNSSPTPSETITPTLSPTATPSMTPTSTSTSTATPTLTPTMTPSLTPTPSSEFVGLSRYGVYASNGTMNFAQGSLTVWLNFERGRDLNDHMILHSDDSRWVFYIDTFYASGLDRNILAIAARAGGNKSATSGSSGHSGYPEARLLIDNDGYLRDIGYGADVNWIGVEAILEGEWHHVAMTWDGYPSGVVKLYLDGVLMSYLQYGPNYDDGQPLFEMISFGFKPLPWPELENLPEYGDVGIGRLASGGIQADDLRIYDRALSQSELVRILVAGIDG